MTTDFKAVAEKSIRCNNKCKVIEGPRSIRFEHSTDCPLLNSTPPTTVFTKRTAPINYDAKAVAEKLVREYAQMDDEHAPQKVEDAIHNAFGLMASITAALLSAHALGLREAQRQRMTAYNSRAKAKQIIFDWEPKSFYSFKEGHQDDLNALGSAIESALTAAAEWGMTEAYALGRQSAMPTDDETMRAASAAGYTVEGGHYLPWIECVHWLRNRASGGEK